MEKRRRCGWLAPEEAIPPEPVWVKNDLVVFECPKSFVSGQSLVFLDAFAVHKNLGSPIEDHWTARKVDAFLVLTAELTREAREDAREVNRSAG